MQYQSINLKKPFSISKIVSVHYFEYTKDYLYTGEKHDFWELVYVDKGSVYIKRGNRWLALEQGEIIFHHPNEFHNIRANGIVAPNLIVIAFQCNSSAMNFFKHKRLSLSDYEKHLLANIIIEAKETFSSPLDDPTLKKLVRKKESLFGSEQMISTVLEQFLISITRNTGTVTTNTTTFQRNTEEKILNDVIDFLHENIHEKLVFQQVIDHIGISASGLKNLFKKKVGVGVMQYFTNLKMNAAKKMIREENLNVTQISSTLGFDSVHLFSRRFRQITGMSPTEYGKSVKAEFEFIKK